MLVSVDEGQSMLEERQLDKHRTLTNRRNICQSFGGRIFGLDLNCCLVFLLADVPRQVEVLLWVAWYCRMC